LIIRVRQARIAKAEGFYTFLLTKVYKDLQSAGSRAVTEQLFQQLQDHYSELSDDEKRAPEALRNRATLFHNMGLVRLQGQEFEDATIALKQARELWRLLPPLEVTSELELTLQALASAEAKQWDRRTAYDIYVSYARWDNERGQVAALVEQIRNDFRASAARDLRVFFDLSEIQGMDDWRLKYQRGLRDSNIFLAILSPHYLASPYCRWEWDNYVRYEAMRQHLGEGIAPVLFVTLPDAAHAETDQAIARWIDEIHRRQTFDLRPWHDAGEQALHQAQVQSTFEQLHVSIRERLDRAERARRSPSNLTRHNLAFVGRVRELTALREALMTNNLATLQGLGGIGKTELALAYAHAVAWDYPGGRWLVSCEQISDLRIALLQLAGPLKFEFTDDENKSLALAFERVLRELNQRERCLLLLDNVSDPSILRAEYLDRLPHDGRVDLIVTTRLAPHNIPGSAQAQKFIDLDELPEEDAVALLRSHQAEGRFASPAEDQEARQIVRLLAGFTLAVETAAIYLGRRPGPNACRQFRERLEADLVGASEAAAGDQKVTVRHRVRSLEETLAFTLQTLTPEARHVLDYASFLPANQVAVPWLKLLGAAEFPSFDAEAENVQNLFRQTLELLLGLRLFQSTDVVDADGRPLVVRIHPLVQDLLRNRQPTEDVNTRQQAVDELVKARAAVFETTTQWQDARWELEPFGGLAQLWADTNHPRATWLLIQAGRHWYDLAEWTQAEPLMRRALAIDEDSPGSDHSNIARDLNVLASLLQATNRLAEAEPLLRRALAINEQNLGTDHPDVASALRNLAQLLQATNRLAEAEPLMRRALAINQQIFGPDHPDVAAALNNLASLLQSTNRLAEAEPLLRQALAVSEHSFGADHPSVARGLNNLALVLRTTNRLGEAEPLMRRALAIDEQSYGPEHPNVARDLNNLALLLQATNRLSESELLLRRALAIDEQSYGPEHPDLARDLNNLASCFQATNRLSEAEPLMRRALAIDEQSYGQEHPDVARDLNNLATLLQATNRLAEAEPLVRRYLEIFLQFTVTTEHEHPHLQTSIENYTRLLQQMGRSQQEIQAQLNVVGRPFGMQFGGE
jgi:Tfp pilus assembly protein PilF